MKDNFPMFGPEPRSCRGESAFGIPKEAKRQKSPEKASRPWKNKSSRAFRLSGGNFGRGDKGCAVSPLWSALARQRFHPQ
jgi:hypothetical protein